MKVNKAELKFIGSNLSHYPKDMIAEIVFVGKSNVGKSSLINTLVNRKALARTSSAPGKTRTINFYHINDEIYFVDLPGYGYAKAAKNEIDSWGDMIEEYLFDRLKNQPSQIKSIIMLIDIRHDLGENDRIMYNFLKHYNYPIIIVATKLDKLKRSQVQKHINSLRTSLRLSADERLIAFSSQTKDGKDELWHEISKLY